MELAIVRQMYTFLMFDRGGSWRKWWNDVFCDHHITYLRQAQNVECYISITLLKQEKIWETAVVVQ